MPHKNTHKSKLRPYGIPKPVRPTKKRKYRLSDGFFPSEEIDDQPEEGSLIIDSQSKVRKTE